MVLVKNPGERVCHFAQKMHQSQQLASRRFISCDTGSMRGLPNAAHPGRECSSLQRCEGKREGTTASHSGTAPRPCPPLTSSTPCDQEAFHIASAPFQQRAPTS